MIERAARAVKHLPGTLRRRVEVARAVRFASRSAAKEVIWDPLGRARGHRPSGPVALFAHFDPQGAVSRYVFGHLAALRTAGFEIVFVSNTRALQADSDLALRSQVDMIILRENVGFDFGAWKDAIDLIDLSRAEKLLLVNDSVYGPLHDIRLTLGRCDAETAEVWGLTDSYSGPWHLQSYLTLFHPDALTNPVFHEFWQGVAYFHDKRAVIDRYEAGLARSMSDGGLRVRALYPCGTVVQSTVQEKSAEMFEHPSRTWRRTLQTAALDLGSVNPTHFAWDTLVASMSFPYLKRELLRANPTRNPAVVRWREVLARTDYDITMITDDLGGRWCG